MCSGLRSERAFGRMGPMARTGVRRGARSAVILALVAAVLAAGRAAGGSDRGFVGPARTVDRHVVRPGETLWDIARARVGPEGDPRPLVEALRRLNRVRPGALAPGLELKVPAAP